MGIFIWCDIHYLTGKEILFDIFGGYVIFMVVGIFAKD